MKKKKIIFYSPVQLTSGGGCERWHCDVTNSIKNQFGFEVEVITANLGQNRWRDDYLKTQLAGIPYTKLDCWVVAGVLIPKPRHVIFLYNKLKEADAVHFIYGFMGQDLLIAFLKLLTGVRVVVGHHAPIFHFSKIHNLYMSFISRWIMRYFDFHQTLNEKDKIYFEQKWGINNVFFIPSGIRIEKFLSIKRKKQSRLSFITVGRYANQKGIDLALEAIERLNKEFPKNNMKFNFVGSGEHESLINQKAKKNKNIKNLGFRKYEELPKLYEESDVYFLPSREEPFGLVLIEGWSSGMPVLATKTEGPLDMLIENKNGWFIPEISVDGIYQGLVDLQERYQKDKQLLLNMEKKCRDTGKKFSIDKTAQRMVQTFMK